MQENYYQNKLYPLQDKVMELVDRSGSVFYLTGGTVLGRFLLKHRYSDDLDFFVNMNPEFKNHVKAVVESFKNNQIHFKIGATSETFARFFIEADATILKLDFVNDVQYHYNGFESCEKFSRLDNWRNIFSNKLCAITRQEPKDIVDIIFISLHYEFEWEDVVSEAREKDLWVDPIEISKLIRQFPSILFDELKWTIRPDSNTLSKYQSIISEDILNGRRNSIPYHKSKALTS